MDNKETDPESSAEDAPNAFENLVEQTIMDEPQREFWLALATGKIVPDRIKPEHVIYRLLTYSPPPYPSDGVLRMECFDIRAERGCPNPENILDAFILDILSVAQTYGVAKRNAWQAVRLYRTMSWRNLAGYRPWTFWNFVQDLNYEESYRLEREVDEALSSGRDWEELHDDLLGLPDEYRDRDFYRRKRNAFAEAKKFYEFSVRTIEIFNLIESDGIPSMKLDELKSELSNAIKEYEENLIPNL